MGSEKVEWKSTSDHDVRRMLFWILDLCGLIAIIGYEYRWTKFALHNPTTSFAEWFWTSLSIAVPWNLGFACAGSLRQAVRSGNIGRDLYTDVRIWLGTLVLSAYLLKWK